MERGRGARRPGKDGRDDAYKAQSAGFVCSHFFFFLFFGEGDDVGSAFEKRILLFGIPAGLPVGIRGESGAEGDTNTVSTELREGRGNTDKV